MHNIDYCFKLQALICSTVRGPCGLILDGDQLQKTVGRDAQIVMANNFSYSLKEQHTISSPVRGPCGLVLDSDQLQEPVGRHTQIVVANDQL